MTIADLVARGVRRARPHVSSSADECLKCNVCNTVCPVLRVTDLFPGPKYEGPQAQRFRLPAASRSRAPFEHAGGVAGPLGRLLLRLRLVHDRLPGGREDRRDEQPGPRAAPRGPAAAVPRLGPRPDRPHRAAGRRVLAARQLRRSATGRSRAAIEAHGRHPPQGAAARRSRKRTFQSQLEARSGGATGARRPGAAGPGRGRRLLPRLRRELLRAPRRGRRDRGPAPQRLRRRSSRRRSAAACR